MLPPARPRRVHGPSAWSWASYRPVGAEVERRRWSGTRGSSGARARAPSANLRGRVLLPWKGTVGTTQAHACGRQEGPDLARRRRRSALAARRARDRDDRPLQPADGPVDDRDRRGTRTGLAGAGRPADADGAQAAA